MEINDLLALCQREHIILQPRGQRLALWSCGQRVPRETREAIRRYRRELLFLIAQSDVKTCPSPTYHRQYFYYQAATRRFVCGACERLESDREMIS